MTESKKTPDPAEALSEEELADVQGGLLPAVNTARESASITDGTSNTITDGTSNAKVGGTYFVLGDGSVRTIK